MISRREFVGLATAAMGTALLVGCEQRGETEATPTPSEAAPEQPEVNSKDRLSGQDGGAEDEAQGEEETKDEGEKKEAEASADQGDAPALEGPVMVAYFSRAGENFARGGNEWLYVGHTKTMAGYIADTLGAETYEIYPSVAYPQTYDDCLTQAKEEKEQDARPEIYYELPDLSSYKTVFVGCPIWWEQEPMIMRTFLDGVDLAGKSVIPFTTHGGSELGSVPQHIQEFAPKAYVHPGHAVEGTEVDASYEEIVEWVQGLNITQAWQEEEEEPYDEYYY